MVALYVSKIHEPQGVSLAGAFSAWLCDSVDRFRRIRMNTTNKDDILRQARLEGEDDLKKAQADTKSKKSVLHPRGFFDGAWNPARDNRHGNPRLLGSLGAGHDGLGRDSSIPLLQDERHPFYRIRAAWFFPFWHRRAFHAEKWLDAL